MRRRDRMRRALLKLLCLVALGLLAVTGPALANVPALPDDGKYVLDCAKTVEAAEMTICSYPELKQADAELYAAYMALLRETKDREFHALLIKSQRRWLRHRLLTPYTYKMAGDEKTSDREGLLIWTRLRLDDLRSGKLIRAMEAQRRIASEVRDGSSTRYDASCGFVSPAYGGWRYACSTSIYRQHRERTCSVTEDRSSGHTTWYRLVRIMKGGRIEMVAGCSIGYATTDAPCPGSYPPGEPLGHWKMHPNVMVYEGPPPNDGGPWTYDPDLEPEQYEQPWMTECLSAPVFPPEELRQP
jgi:uncharacterized protein YecT (DUF1311 family)